MPKLARELFTQLDDNESAVSRVARLGSSPSANLVSPRNLGFNECSTGHVSVSGVCRALDDIMTAPSYLGV